MSLSHLQRESLFADMDIFSSVVRDEMDSASLEIVLAPYLAILSYQERDAVSLVVMHRFTYAQAANFMGVRRSAVFEYIRRAKEKWGRLSRYDRIDTCGFRNVSG
ncbi:hypothetical protein CEB3_c19550 [Peptococcaceae bacterium CEB3]|nr:hypothetical protein CEB3_c19550 [Peptococcaceae bacterium CEB3]